MWEEVTSKLSTLVENIWYFATLFAVTIVSNITHARYLYAFAIAASYPLTTDVCNHLAETGYLHSTTSLYRTLSLANQDPHKMWGEMNTVAIRYCEVG